MLPIHAYIPILTYILVRDFVEMGSYSVHTSRQALLAGEAEIMRVRGELKNKGIL